jgi:N-formylglutamate deformylase
MPHEAIDGVSPVTAAKPEIVLGDRFGSAASAEIVDRIEAAFAAEGLRVSRNTPFAGAFITQHYGRPMRNQHVVQIEIDRSLYLHEPLVEPNANFAEFKRLLTRVGAEIAEIGRSPLPMAAE